LRNSEHLQKVFYDVERATLACLEQTDPDAVWEGILPTFQYNSIVPPWTWFGE